jgi:NADH-quinone oxidoreductase subunit N
MTGFAVLAPLATIVVGAILVLLLEAFVFQENKSPLAELSILTLAGAGLFAGRLWGRGEQAFGSLLRWDDAALFLMFIFLAAGVFAILLGMRFLVQQEMNYGEFYGLILLAVAGLVIMTATADLLVIFLGLEVFSVSSYALAGLKRRDERSVESAVKYFLLGSFASAFMVFGLALLYGGAHTLDAPSLASAIADPAASSSLALAGVAFIICGLAFKIALVPFHMYQPDVYEGAPTPVTAFFVVAPKTAGFAILLRILIPYARSGFRKEAVFGFLTAVAIATMILGNFGALRQRNLKRILAYSSIAQAGYMLIAVIAGDPAGLLFYLTNYLFLGIGTFAAIIALGSPGRVALDLDDLAGVGRRFPWIGGIFAVLLVSLAGFPPTGGFLAKFYVFSAAVRAGHLALAVVGVLTSLISVYYYLRIIVVMFMKEAEQEKAVDIENPAVYLVLFLCFYAVLQLGLFPGNIITLIRQAVALF